MNKKYIENVLGERVLEIDKDTGIITALKDCSFHIGVFNSHDNTENNNREFVFDVIEMEQNEKVKRNDSSNK